MSRRFAGKTIVVTGSGRKAGLGTAILQRFADEGANCVVSDLATPQRHMGAEHIGSSAEMDEVAGELQQRGAQAIAIACDVASETAVENLVSRTVDHFGKIDVFVNNAGIGYLMKPLLKTTQAEWQSVLNVNLMGAFLCTKHAALHMVARGGGGRIINIASQAAKSGFPHMAPYCASKHGMIGLTRSNAIELGPQGITVNAICPNHVTTGLGAAQNAYFAELLGFADVASYLANMAARNPSGRPGYATDTAAACAFLASDDACYINGEAINVSGGEEMH